MWCSAQVHARARLTPKEQNHVPAGHVDTLQTNKRNLPLYCINTRLGDLSPCGGERQMCNSVLQTLRSGVVYPTCFWPSPGLEFSLFLNRELSLPIGVVLPDTRMCCTRGQFCCRVNSWLCNQNLCMRLPSMSQGLKSIPLKSMKNGLFA